jgi:hypothetical protein
MNHIRELNVQDWPGLLSSRIHVLKGFMRDMENTLSSFSQSPISAKSVAGHPETHLRSTRDHHVSSCLDFGKRVDQLSRSSMGSRYLPKCLARHSGPFVFCSAKFRCLNGAKRFLVRRSEGCRRCRLEARFKRGDFPPTCFMRNSSPKEQAWHFFKFCVAPSSLDRRICLTSYDDHCRINITHLES